jgi:hypothetical protein
MGSGFAAKRMAEISSVPVRLLRLGPVEVRRADGSISGEQARLIDFASLPLQSSLMSKTYLKSDHFNGGGSAGIGLLSRERVAVALQVYGTTAALRLACKLLKA